MERPSYGYERHEYQASHFALVVQEVRRLDLGFHQRANHGVNLPATSTRSNSSSELSQALLHP